MNFAGSKTILRTEWRLLGVPDWYMVDNPVVDRILGTARWRSAPVVAGCLVGLMIGWFERDGQIARIALRVVSVELLTLLGALLLINWMKQRWLRTVLMDDLDLTLLSDGEICHGLWVSHLLPLLRALFGLLIGETFIFLLATTFRFSRSGLTTAASLEAGVWLAFPVLAFWFCAYTVRMLGPRLLFAAVQGPSERSYLATAGLMLAESYGVLLLVLPIVLFTAIFAAVLASMIGADIGQILILVFLLLQTLFKRDLSESYHLSIQSSWRAWLAWQREGLEAD